MIQTVNVTQQESSLYGQYDSRADIVIVIIETNGNGYTVALPDVSDSEDKLFYLVHDKNSGDVIFTTTNYQYIDAGTEDVLTFTLESGQKKVLIPSLSLNKWFLGDIQGAVYQ